MVIAIQTQGHLTMGGDAEMQAEMSNFCSGGLCDAC